MGRKLAALLVCLAACDQQPTETLGKHASALNVTGDLNGDGSVNAVDLQIEANVILGTAQNAGADLNGDGSVNAVDLQTLVNIVLAGGPDPCATQTHHCFSADHCPSDPVYYNCYVVNTYRIAGGLQPYHLNDTLTTQFSYNASVQYSQDHSPHAYFIANYFTLFSWGASAAGENQGYWYGWPVADATNAVNNEKLQIEQVVKAWMDEGPTGGHYQNVMSTQYYWIGCGLLEICGDHTCAAGETGGLLYMTNDFTG